jgi:hypothetical protein
MTTGSIAFRADETRHRRTDTVGADHEFSRNLPLSIVSILKANTGDATVVRADQIDELRFEHDRCTGVLRGIDKHPVNDSTSRCVETINVVLRFDRNRDDLVAVVKRCRSNHRRTGGFDSV